MTEPGAEIHGEHPFATPARDRDAARRFRGRLAAPVTLWAAGAGRQRAGLTMASTMVVDGDPVRVLGLIDPDSDLFDAIERTGRFTVSLLSFGQQRLAEQFAGLMPAPGGLFAQDEWADTDWGPVLTATSGWLCCRRDAAVPMGWSSRIEGTVEQVTVTADEPALVHRRGRYHRIDPA